MKKQDLQTGYQLSSLEYWTFLGYASTTDYLAIVNNINDYNVQSSLFSHFVMYDQTKRSEYIDRLLSECFHIASENETMYEGYILHQIYMAILDKDINGFEESMISLEEINFDLHRQILKAYEDNNERLSEGLAEIIEQYIF